MSEYNKTIADYVLSLAKKNNLIYKENHLDNWAKKITELSDYKVRKDDTLDLLIALKRNGIISNKDVVNLASKHLKEIRNM